MPITMTPSESPATEPEAHVATELKVLRSGEFQVREYLAPELAPVLPPQKAPASVVPATTSILTPGLCLAVNGASR